MCVCLCECVSVCLVRTDTIPLLCRPVSVAQPEVFSAAKGPISAACLFNCVCLCVSVCVLFLLGVDVNISTHLCILMRLRLSCEVFFEIVLMKTQRADE